MMILKGQRDESLLIDISLSLSLSLSLSYVEPAAFLTLPCCLLFSTFFPDLMFCLLFFGFMQKAALVTPQSEPGSDGGFRWLMMSPNGGTTPSQWASNIPMELQEGSPAPSGEELMVDLQLPGEEEALPHQTLKSTVVVPDDFDPRSLRELRKEIAGRSKKDENQEIAVEQPKAVKKEKKPKAVKQQQAVVVVKELEEEKEDDMVTNMSTDLLANRIRSEHPRHWRFGGSDDGAVEEEQEEVEWEDEFEYEGEEGDECQVRKGGNTSPFAVSFEVCVFL